MTGLSDLNRCLVARRLEMQTTSPTILAYDREIAKLRADNAELVDVLAHLGTVLSDMQATKRNDALWGAYSRVVSAVAKHGGQ